MISRASGRSGVASNPHDFSGETETRVSKFIFDLLLSIEKYTRNNQGQKSSTVKHCVVYICTWETRVKEEGSRLQNAAQRTPAWTTEFCS